MTMPPPPVMPPAPHHDPGAPATPPRRLDAIASTPARRNRRGWLLLIVALVMGLIYSGAWANFVIVRMGPHPPSTVPAGTPWTDEHGTVYTVKSAERMHEIESYSKLVAPQGAVYLLVEVHVTNYHKKSSCYQELIGPHRERYHHEGRLPMGKDGQPGDYPQCPSVDEAPREFTYWLSYLVPEDRVPKMMGITNYFMRYRQPPVLGLPPSQ